MSNHDLWRWKINVVRVMGNSHDRRYVPDLVQAFQDDPDERVRAMAVWAFLNIIGQEAASIVSQDTKNSDHVIQEFRRAKQAFPPDRG
ncbi:MAG: HEAT repeat domain-containing protein [Pseudomonadota bacterium]